MSSPTLTSAPSAKVTPGLAPGRDSAPLPFPAQLRDPQRYELLGEHGRGGLGRVSRAHDRELGRDVAIKELLARGYLNEVRFRREALITARLEHPGIVPVHEAGHWPDGTPFYAMKLVSGRPLRDLIAERTTVEQRVGLLHHVIAVADAIAYAHGRQIIHRDLKPANVIIGDFGETIVIDWGLAKDLTRSEELGAGCDPPPDRSDAELTTTGSILGTPAYMAPEQERGEPVDQRADVFAIGVMLWELCTVERTPPTDAQLRRRALRRAGIDRDLATIIDKALERDPERRYPDAGALAADLKAFKAGARIAARSYSLLAMLAHWTRRHRTLALSAAAAIAIAVTGSLLYVRNIAAERDRAAAAEGTARTAQASAEASLHKLTLKHAELLLTTDPSAASDALASYDGPERGRANQILAEARGRGVAFLRARPHTDSVLWAQGTAGGAIVSLGTDGTISRTARDGTPTVVARGVSKSALSSYSPARRLLAYTCDPAGVCLLDVRRATRIPSASALRSANAIAIDFAPDGALLAVLSQDGVLSIFDIADPDHPALRFSKKTDGALDVKFVGDDVVVTGSLAGIEFVRMDGSAERFSLPELSRWDASASERKLALANTRGQGLVLEAFPLRVTARAELCHGQIAGLKLVPGRQSIAYACRDGAIGLWDLQRGTLGSRAQLEGHAARITVSAKGDYIVAAGSNDVVTIVDLDTGLVASYKGHGFRLTSITPPTTEHPFVISGDVRGGIRAWQLPARVARVAVTSRSPFQTAMFDEQSTTVVATTWLPALTVFSPSAGVRAVEPHDRENMVIARSTNGRTFATYGLHDSVEVWSPATMTRTRDIPTGHGSISQLQFVGDSDDFITAGHDGRLVRWTPSGAQIPIAHVEQPIDELAQTAPSGSIVFSTADGALWRTDGGQALALRPGGARVHQILAPRDHPAVYVGYANGDVIAIDTRSWRLETVLRGTGAVQEIAATRDGQTIAVAMNDGTIHINEPRGGMSPLRGGTWVALATRAHHIALAPDGLLVAACTDGTIWLYSPARERWLCLPTGTVDLGQTVVSDDGKAAVALDSEGRLLWIDLESARELLDDPAGTYSDRYGE